MRTTVARAPKPSSLELRERIRGLPEAQTSVVWRNLHVKPQPGAQLCDERVEEQSVLEDSARDDDAIGVVCVRHRGYGVGYGRMKCACDLARRPPGAAIGENTRKHRPIVELISLVGKHVRRDGSARSSQMLEPHRGLSFEALLASESGKRRDRIEETPHRCGLEGSDTVLYERAGICIPLRKGKRRPIEIDAVVDVVKKARRGLQAKASGAGGRRE